MGDGKRVRNRNIKKTRKLKNRLKGYITHFYNKKSLHSALNYCSIVEFKQ